MNDKVKKKKKEKVELKVQNMLEAGIGPYELTRLEKREKNGKKELAARKVDTDEKKVTDYYVKDGKKIVTEEELGAVQRRGIDLSQKDQNKLKLLGVKQAAKGGMINKKKKKKKKVAGRLAKRGYGAAKK